MIKPDFFIDMFKTDTLLPYMSVQESHAFAMFYAHALRGKRGIPDMHARITLTTFTRFAQNSTVGCMLALHGPTMHVATLKPYLQAR